MEPGKVVCITGIDTDIGKSIVTGILGRYLLKQGKSVITQKICQTGCQEVSDDILTHRKIMGIELQDVDRKGLTCPYIFSEPCSPHLAAQLEGEEIDPSRITSATSALTKIYDFVLLEGVGGLMVPLLQGYTLADYLQDMKYKQILVSCSRLGSINHTLSALEIMQGRALELLGIVYNRFLDSNAVIARDSRDIFAQYLRNYGFRQKIVDVAQYQPDGVFDMSDFSPIMEDF